MCGLWGIAGSGFLQQDLIAFEELGHVNQFRGHHASGVFEVMSTSKSQGRLLKIDEDFNYWLYLNSRHVMTSNCCQELVSVQRSPTWDLRRTCEHPDQNWSGLGYEYTSLVHPQDDQGCTQCPVHQFDRLHHGCILRGGRLPQGSRWSPTSSTTYGQVPSPHE